MTQRTNERDRTGRVESPRNGQYLRATGEGVSVNVEDILDDDVNASDGSCTKQTRRDSSFKTKSQKKGKRKDQEKGNKHWHMECSNYDARREIRTTFKGVGRPHS